MKHFGVMVVLVGMLLPLAAEAAQGRSEDTVVDRLGDWVATLGKPKAQAQSLVRRRQAERARQRAKARAAAPQPAERSSRPETRYGIMGEEAVQVEGSAGSGARAIGEHLRQDVQQLDTQQEAQE